MMGGRRREGLMRLGPGDRTQALRFLGRNPAENAYLLWQVGRGALIHDEVAGPMYGFWRSGFLEGLACCGTNLALSEPMAEAATEALSERLDAIDWPCRVVVGPDAAVARLMDQRAAQRPEVSLERAGQVLFVVTGETLHADARTSGLVVADPSMLDRMVALDREMVLEELGYDPFVHDLEAYRMGWLRRLREGRSWIIKGPDGDVVFKVDQSALDDEVIQLAGVYTTPQHRRSGLARQGVGEMACRLLETVPRVSLYVHSLNLPAMALYASLGFERRGLIRSVWFAHGSEAR